MVLNLNEVISIDTFDKIVNAFNQMKDEDKLDIYLSTPGGNVEIMEAIIDFLSRNSDKVNLFGYGELSSAGFFIMFQSQCNRTILPGTIGMTHLVTITARMIGDPANWKSKSESKSWHIWSKADKKRRLVFLRELGLTEEEVEEVANGGEVYIQPNRMQQFLKNQQGY